MPRELQHVVDGCAPAHVVAAPDHTALVSVRASGVHLRLPAVCHPLEANFIVCFFRTTMPRARLGAWRVVHVGNHVRGAAEVDDPLRRE